MKINKEIVGLIVLLLIFVVSGMLLTNPDENSTKLVGSELSADPSIYNDRASGSRAFFEFSKKLGYDAKVETRDWSHLPPDSQMLISIAPESVQGFDVLGAATGSSDSGKLTASDANGVVKWLKPGRTLLLLSSRLPANLYFPGGESSASSNADQNPTFGDVIGATVETAQYDKQVNYTPLQISPLVAGVGSIALSSSDSRVERPTRDYVPLFATIDPAHDGYVRTEPVAIEIAEGKGRIIIISDDYFASNTNIAQADNAAFLYNIIATSSRAGAPILFDEYHHSDVGTPSNNLWAALGEPIQASFVQLMLCLVLLIALVAPRFGSVKTIARGNARTSGEYLTSLADLFRRADATIPSLEIIYRQFLRDLCQRLALPPDVPLDQLADLAAKRAKIKPEGLRQLIAACESALDTKTLSGPDLLALTRQMEMVKRQLD